MSVGGHLQLGRPAPPDKPVAERRAASGELCLRRFMTWPNAVAAAQPDLVIEIRHDVLDEIDATDARDVFRR